MGHPAGRAGPAIDHDELAAPDGSVRTEAGAVPRHPQDPVRTAVVLEQTGEDVGEVMLHLHDRHA